MKKIIKVVIIYFIIFAFFLLSNSGLILDDWQSIFQNIVFSAITLALIYQPNLKKGFVILSLLLLTLTGLFFVLDYIFVADAFGTLGFGIIVISGLFYIPRLFKDGHI